VKSWWGSGKSDLELGRPGRIGKVTPAHETNSEQSHNIRNEARGAQIVQNNQISTPQMVAIVIAILISCLALALWYNTSSTMQLYEREIRLAQRDAQDAKNQANTLKEVLEIVGLKVPKKDNDNEQR